MKIVVIGGSGLIGKKLVSRLRGLGHDVVAASPRSGVNTITREGLAEALLDAQVVVDVSNSPSFEDKPVLEFFDRSTRNLMAASTAAGISHVVALSIVGLERLPDSGYFRAKLAQETLIRNSGLPFTLVRATQFFEFVDAIIAGGAQDDIVRLPSAQFQPVATDDVVATLADAATAPALNRMIEIAGPDRDGMDAFARRQLAARGDHRSVIGSPEASYFGADIDDRSLTPDADARIGAISFADWLAQPHAI